MNIKDLLKLLNEPYPENVVVLDPNKQRLRQCNCCHRLLDKSCMHESIDDIFTCDDCIKKA